MDQSFHPYLYILPKDDDASAFLRKLKAERSEAHVERRRLFGREVDAVKMVFKDSAELDRFVKTSRKRAKETILLGDVRYSDLYLLDSEVRPCGWHETEAEETQVPRGVKVDKAYVSPSNLRCVEEIHTPSLRILSFSAVYHQRVGSPKPEEDAVLVLSTVASDGEKRTFTARGLDDREPIKAFTDYVAMFDPDILATFRGNKFDLPFLAARAKHLGSKFPVDKTRREPHTSLYGHSSVTGRANVDLGDFIDDMPDIKLKTLHAAAEYFGILPRQDLLQLEATEVADRWKSPRDQASVVEFCEQNAWLTWRLCEFLLDYAIQLSNIVGMPLDMVGSAATGFRVDWYLMREAGRLGELPPQRTEQPYYPYRGAVVSEPKPGLHGDIVVLDFTSMYPNLMIKYNISPDTYVPPSVSSPESEVYVAPEVDHRFRKKPSGFYTKVLSALIHARQRTQDEMRKHPPASVQHRILDARQRSIKTLTNATYGYCGWVGARWYRREVAEATSAWGRHTIQATIRKAENLGLDVIYSDTDSIFVRKHEEKIASLLNYVNQELGLEIKPSAEYTRILFTEAKKRYAGLLREGALDIVGLEVARGDWAEVARVAQVKALDIILREENVQNAVAAVKDFVETVRTGGVPFKQYIIWKALAKPLEEYEVHAPHVEAARKLVDKGWKVSVGDYIGYVITKGEGKPHERAAPYLYAKMEDVDYDYYVDNQIIPAVGRVLSILGVSETELPETKPGPRKPSGKPLRDAKQTTLA
ncbi:MAG: DNA-directed DNA polymerase [Candidatus Bathyarchaeia archaeon]